MSLQEYVRLWRRAENEVNDAARPFVLFRLQASLAHGPSRDLLAFGYDPAQAQIELDVMLEELRAGRPTFLMDDGPITRDMVRERLRKR